jgi:hypothetical protein
MRPRRPDIRRNPAGAAATALLAALSWSVPATAAEPVGDSTPSPAARPALAQLSRETEALYREVRGGMLRVQMKPARGDPSGESPLTKYKELDPKVREALARGNAAPPAGRTASDADVKLDAGAALIVVPPPAAPVATGQDAAFTPNTVGLLLDERGHVLVPLHVDPAAPDAAPVRVCGPDGRVVQARVIGSDRQTSLTVLQLPQPGGTPLHLAEDDRPVEGSLVLLVAPGDATAKIGLWTGAGRESAVIFSVDGRCAGIARLGQFLSGRACRLIAEQIIRYGSVKRATLGVIITELRRDDPARQQVPALGDRAAVRIDQVMPGSAADKAGLRGGDLLLSLAGEPVGDIPGLSAAIAARSGETEFQVLRGGEVVKISVDLQQK